MIARRMLPAVAVLALMFAVSSPALAGGGGGGSKSKVNVRVKNFTADPVGVAVANKNPTAFRALNPNQVTQFKVNKGSFIVDDELEQATFNTRNRKTVYVALTDEGIQDTTTKF